MISPLRTYWTMRLAMLKLGCAPLAQHLFLTGKAVPLCVTLCYTCC